MFETELKKLVILFCILLIAGLNWNVGFLLITGLFVLFLAAGILFYNHNIDNKIFFIFKFYEGDSKIDFAVAYSFFYLFLVFFGLIVSWIKITKRGIQGYHIRPKVLALKRPVYFIYFSFIFLITIISYFVKILPDNFKLIFILSIIISLLLIIRDFNLLVDSWNIKENDIIQSFDCEEIEINKIDE